MNPLVIATVGAVLIDSIVTLVVGLKLNSTAEKKIAEGVKSIVDHAPEIVAKALEGGNNGESQS